MIASSLPVASTNRTGVLSPLRVDRLERAPSTSVRASPSGRRSVSMTRVAIGPDAVGEPGLRGDPALRVVRRRAAADEARRAGPSGSQVTSQTSSHTLGEAALDQLDRLDDDGRGVGRLGAPRSRARIRGRTAGWTIASRSRSAAGSAKTIRPSAARSSVPSPRSTPSPEPRDDRRRAPARPGSTHLARDLVGVDDHDARPLAEPARDRRLAAADRPGQPDPRPSRRAAPRARARHPRRPRAPRRRRPARS